MPKNFVLIQRWPRICGPLREKLSLFLDSKIIHELLVKTFFHFIRMSAVHIIFICLIPFTGTMNCPNWPAPNVWVFIAQLVEHCSANAEAMGSNPVEAPKTFLGLTLRLLKSQSQPRWSHLLRIFFFIATRLWPTSACTGWHHTILLVNFVIVPQFMVVIPATVTSYRFLCTLQRLDRDHSSLEAQKFRTHWTLIWKNINRSRILN